MFAFRITWFVRSPIYFLGEVEGSVRVTERFRQLVKGMYQHHSTASSQSDFDMM